MATELHFSRFEFKYIMHAELRNSFEGELQYFMGLDPHVSAVRRQKYFVRSLYFDDDALTFYYEKTDGVMIRKKYRIRTYTDDQEEDSAIFLEMKGRYNSLVYKHRTPLPRSIIKSLDEGGSALVTECLRLGKDPLVSGFLFDAIKMRLKPRVLIDYARRPYVSRFAPDFRVTFDDSLESIVTGRLFGSHTDRKRLLLPGYSIVEVKFMRHIPSWFHRLIQSYELKRLSISKYCKGMERTGLADNLE